MSSLAVLDIDPAGVDEVLPALPNASSVFIHTGNIINRGFVYKRSPTVTEEIKLTCVKTLGKWLASVNKHETKDLESVDMDYNQFVNASRNLEDRKNLKLTVKLFVVNAGPDCVKQALNKVGQKLSTGYVETLILSLPGTAQGLDVTYKGLIGPYWEAAESVAHFTFDDMSHHTECRRNSTQEESLESDELVCSDGSMSPRTAKYHKARDVGISWTIGLSDLNATSLADVYDHAQTEKPLIDQINMDVCCSPPEDLVTLCKEKDIQLLTHNDPRDILNQESLQEILSSHLNHHKDLVGWKVGWVLRYSALVKCRGIIQTKGYIVNLVRNPADYLPQ